MHYQKLQSVAKRILPRGAVLRARVAGTLRDIAEMVGATLGPQGRPVLIERQETDLPPIVTKDGVTVFRHLGFQDSFAQMIMESARDSADRVARDAGDGTTTATILADSIYRHMDAWCEANPHRSPQQAIRELERAFRDDVEPAVRKAAIPAQLGTPEGDERLRAVARVSANGDDDLADAVLQCFQICGDSGNVTLLEVTGPSRYAVEEVDGFPIAQGWEDSCRKFYPAYLNDAETGRCRLDNPLFILFNGPVNDAPFLINVLQNTVAGMWAENATKITRNYVVVATRFSEQVLGTLAANFQAPDTIKVFPLEAPLLPVANSQVHFLEDLAAVTGAKVFDALNKPLDTLTIEDLGAYQEETEQGVVWRSPLEAFEASRYRSTVFGHADDDELGDRVAVLEAARPEIESELEGRLLQERIAKLSGGIARLRIFGLSNGETKEKRDRAEDAVCAVRGAIKDGILPGAGWALLRVSQALAEHPSEAVRAILCPALVEPVHVLFRNAGYGVEERDQALVTVLHSIKKKPTQAVVYDLLNHGHVSAVKAGLFDSLPAVLEAIRCSLSIASRLGGLGGLVAFARDRELEREEASSTHEFVRHVVEGTSTQRYVEGVGEDGEGNR